MDPQINPFSVLTFIVAPAILTNAASVMTMGTSTRFARAVDRVRTLSALVENESSKDPEEHDLHRKQLRAAERRTILLVRSLTAYYTSVGSFAAASLTSLLGGVFVIAGMEIARNVALGVALAAGIIGVGGLVAGSAFLVGESRMTLRILKYETNYRLKRSTRV
jgi:hypothetical protein